MSGAAMGVGKIIILTGCLFLSALSAAGQESVPAPLPAPLSAPLPAPLPVAIADSLGAVADITAEGELPGVIDLEPPVPDFWSTGVSSTSAVLMTPLFPGWGQLYTDNSWRAALAYGLEMFYWSNMLVRDRRAVRAKEFGQTFPADNINRDRYNAIALEDWEQMRDFAWWSGGVLLIIALDSYVGAHLFNFDSDAVPVPNDWEGQFGPSQEDVLNLDSGPTILVFQHGWRF